MVIEKPNDEIQMKSLGVGSMLGISNINVGGLGSVNLSGGSNFSRWSEQENSFFNMG